MKLRNKSLDELRTLHRALEVNPIIAGAKEKKYGQIVNTATGNDMIISEDLCELAVDGLKYLDALALSRELLFRLASIEAHFKKYTE